MNCASGETKVTRTAVQCSNCGKTTARDANTAGKTAYKAVVHGARRLKLGGCNPAVKTTNGKHEGPV